MYWPRLHQALQPELRALPLLLPRQRRRSLAVGGSVQDGRGDLRVRGEPGLAERGHDDRPCDDRRAADGPRQEGPARGREALREGAGAAEPRVFGGRVTGDAGPGQPRERLER